MLGFGFFFILEGNCDDCSGVWFYLAEVALHEVNLADAPEVLLKNVNLGTLRYIQCADAKAKKESSLVYLDVRTSGCFTRKAHFYI